METTAWTAADVSEIRDVREFSGRVITASDVRPILADRDLWDVWPVQEMDGTRANIAGGELWMGLSAEIGADPVERHGRARIRLLHLVAGEWRDLGNLLPDGFSPGSREWSGSAIVDADHQVLTLFFTAAGRRGEKVLTYEQRLFRTSAHLFVTPTIRLKAWTDPTEIVASDGAIYERANQAEGTIGAIKAFRDPAWFVDPADGVPYMLFTASLGGSKSPFNGVIGVARAKTKAADDWVLLPPLISADGLNNELERPHVIYRDGWYYLFWSTQRSVFAPEGPAGPTGLYGMAAKDLLGPYKPLNGSGLVLCNPPEAPNQAYSWLVLDDLTAVSFIDNWGLSGESPPDTDTLRKHFGGTIAPVAKIRLPQLDPAF